MFSCNVFSSRHHDVCSLAEAPAVGSGAPQTYKQMRKGEFARRFAMITKDNGLVAKWNNYGIDGRWLGREELIKKALSGRKDLLRQFADEILSEFLQLITLQTAKRFANWSPEGHQMRLHGA